METRFFHWTDGEAGGVFKIGCGNTFEYTPISGSCISTDALISLVGFADETQWIRENLKGLARVNPWRIKSRIGMSGCEDYYVEHLCGDIIKKSPKVLHRSMYGKANEALSCWVKDFYDLIWALGYVDKDPTEKMEITIRDVTDSVINSKKEFLENSKNPQEGWGYEEALIDEDELYK